MATNGETKEPHNTIIGNSKSFWLWNSDSGFDLTHPSIPDAPAISPRVRIETTTTAITIDPAKSALVIIDMQNFFLSPALGRAKGNGHKALDQLVQNAIPACRKAGIRVVWVNWGLTQDEVENMPSALLKAFGFEKDSLRPGPGGLGSDMGTVTDPESTKEIQVGKMLMRDQWNTDVYPPLDKWYAEGQQLDTRPDVWIHKNRMSGAWGTKPALEEYLEKEGIRTLFFTGVNTDQCVGGTYQDCHSKGYDCVLLSDGCGTTSPTFAKEMIEFNAANSWGFVTSCKALADGVEAMK